MVCEGKASFFKHVGSLSELYLAEGSSRSAKIYTPSDVILIQCEGNRVHNLHCISNVIFL